MGDCGYYHFFQNGIVYILVFVKNVLVAVILNGAHCEMDFFFQVFRVFSERGKPFVNARSEFVFERDKLRVYFAVGTGEGM